MRRINISRTRFFSTLKAEDFFKAENATLKPEDYFKRQADVTRVMGAYYRLGNNDRMMYRDNGFSIPNNTILQPDELALLRKQLGSFLKVRNQKDTYDVEKGGKPTPESKMMCATQIRHKMAVQYKKSKPWQGVYLRSISIARQLNIEAIKGHDDIDLDYDSIYYAKAPSSLPWHQPAALSPPFPDKLETACTTVYIALQDHINGEALLRFAPQKGDERSLLEHEKTGDHRFGRCIAKPEESIPVSLKQGQIAIFHHLTPWTLESNLPEMTHLGYALTFRFINTIKYCRNYGVAHVENDPLDWY